MARIPPQGGGEPALGEWSLQVLSCCTGRALACWSPIPSLISAIATVAPTINDATTTITANVVVTLFCTIIRYSRSINSFLGKN